MGKNKAESVTFTSDAPFTVTAEMSLTNPEMSRTDIEYRSGYTWTRWRGRSVRATLESDDNYRACFRGTCNRTMRFKFVIDAQVPVHLSGNCMALLDYRAAKRGDEAMMDKYAFAGLFEGQNIGSVTRDFLPAKNLMESCYLAMFKDCINLMIPPDLPAKQMAADCYESMFERCTSLQTLPKFNFTNPERFCFHNMFERAVYYLNPNNIPQELLEENLYCKDMFLNAIDKGGAIQ